MKAKDMISSIRAKNPILLSLLLPMMLLGHAAGQEGSPSTDEIVAKARDYLGGDEVLDTVKSIYYRGTFETSEGISGEVEIMFQKPLYQRVKTIRDDVEEITALSYYDGWRKITERDNDSNWTLVFLETDQIRELQANTWENLHFFKNIERRRGRIENHGLVEFDGRECVKLTFHHPGNVYFDRYFDSGTGQLLMTEASTGGQITEYGETRVEGVRFPESITMTREGEIMNRISFEEIAVNREFDVEKFDVPSMAPGSGTTLPELDEEDLLEIPTAPIDPEP